MQDQAPKYAVGDELTIRKQLWKITAVYGYRESYGSVVYAAVRWVKSTQKWSGNAYLHTERSIEREGS